MKQVSPPEDPTRPLLEEARQHLSTIRDFLRLSISLFNRAALCYGHGTTNALDEAAFIILETLKLPIDELEPYLDARLTPAERQMLADIILKRIETRKPAPYLLNRAYIQGIPFYVDERVIVPRSFIGEILFSDHILPLPPNAPPPERILDLCTGSGCLAILAAHLYPDAQIDAVDLSADALAVAHINVGEAGMENRIRLLQGDLFAPLEKNRYDLIIANPPYVRQDTVDHFPPEHRHEPEMAHAGGTDGFDLVRKIITGSPDHLTPHGGLICEIGTDRDMLESEYPEKPFLWLDTEHSEGEVFWLARADM